MKNDSLLIAQIGKTVGLKGSLKLNIFTDFPEQFKRGAKFETARGSLEVLSFDARRNIIKFRDFEDIDSARRLTNLKIYSSIEETKKDIELKDGEYFWFDIIGSSVIEGTLELGTIQDIQRVADVDYLNIKTAQNIAKEKLPKSFLIPYLDRYILSVDSKNRKIFVKDALLILEES